MDIMLFIVIGFVIFFVFTLFAVFASRTKKFTDDSNNGKSIYKGLADEIFDTVSKKQVKPAAVEQRAAVAESQVVNNTPILETVFELDTEDKDEIEIEKLLDDEDIMVKFIIGEMIMEPKFKKRFARR